MINAHQQGEGPIFSTKRIGAVKIFERLWSQTGSRQVIQDLLADRKFGFPVERAIFLTVLHRLLAPGSNSRPSVGGMTTRSRIWMGLSPCTTPLTHLESKNASAEPPGAALLGATAGEFVLIHRLSPHPHDPR